MPEKFSEKPCEIRKHPYSRISQRFKSSLKFVEDKMKFLISTTYYLCWDVVIVAHVPWVLFVELPLSESYLSCVCMVPSWTLVSVVFTGCCLSGSYLNGVCKVFAWC